MQHSRAEILHIYKQILREAEKMPTPLKKNWVRFKARKEFGEAKSLQTEEEVHFHVLLAETHLESLQVQVKNLADNSTIDVDALYKRDFEPLDVDVFKN